MTRTFKKEYPTLLLNHLYFPIVELEVIYFSLALVRNNFCRAMPIKADYENIQNKFCRKY